MAKITAVLAASHSPFMFQPVEWWLSTRARRSLAAEAPAENAQEMQEKHARIQAGWGKLRDIFRDARPDVMLVFGDDQHEQLDLTNHPAFAVYVGGRFEGYRAVSYEGPNRKPKPRLPEHWTSVETHRPLASHVLETLMSTGFDPAFMLELRNREIGMGHAFMRPAGPLTDGRFDVPMVPILVNCMYAPQPTAARCVDFARAVRTAVTAWPEDVNVAIIGSGGLWHTPGGRDSYLDEGFDREILESLQRGDVEHSVAYFDKWTPEPGLAHRGCFEQFTGGTGMRGGVGSGAGETRNWLMAAAVAERPAILVDYIPVHSSPCGVGFAYWDMRS